MIADELQVDQSSFYSSLHDHIHQLYTTIVASSLTGCMVGFGGLFALTAAGGLGTDPNRCDWCHTQTQPCMPPL